MKPKPGASATSSLERARNLYLEHAFDQARSLCLRMQERDQEVVAAEHLLGLMDAKEGKLESAAARMRKVVAGSPDHADYWADLGMVLRLLGLFEAEEVLQHAVELEPSHANALCHLAELKMSLGDPVGARALWTRSLAHHPKHFPSLLGLSRLNEEAGRFDEASAFLRRACLHSQSRAGEWKMLAQLHLRAQRYEEARLAMEEALRREPSTRESWRTLLRIVYLLADPQKAGDACRRWLRHHPGDAEAAHMLASFGAADAPGRASDAYVKTVFDPFAREFDENLQRLQYQAPELVARELGRRLRDKGVARVDRLLDAGCGTGLSGVPLRPLAGRMDGVDLSAGMLAKARERGLYEVLYEGELTQWLATSPQGYDAVTCADTLIYFGDLGDILRGMHSVLAPGGLLVATAETHAGSQPWVLGFSGRYAHSRAYLEAEMARLGFADVRVETVCLRHEQQVPVQGWLFSGVQT